MEKIIAFILPENSYFIDIDLTIHGGDAIAGSFSKYENSRLDLRYPQKSKMQITRYEKLLIGDRNVF